MWSILPDTDFRGIVRSSVRDVVSPADARGLPRTEANTTAVAVASLARDEDEIRDIATSEAGSVAALESGTAGSSSSAAQSTGCRQACTDLRAASPIRFPFVACSEHSFSVCGSFDGEGRA
jgi:hypothetical protein